MRYFKVGLRNARFILVLLLPVVASCSESTEPPASDASHGLSAASETNIGNGEYVVGFAHCSGCHSSADSQHPGSSGYLAGSSFTVGGSLIHIPNITPDTETGIGSWSDKEVEAALRDGVRPDGTQLHPLMPYRFLQHTTATDMRDMIAYLRTIPAVVKGVPRNETIALDAESFGYPPAPPTAEETDETIARGAYVAWLADCMGCHTPATNGVADFENKLGVGGNLFEGPVPAIAANITPHSEDGIGDYSVQDIATVLKTAIRPDGTDLAPIMGPRLETASQSDLEAVATYLKSLPPKPSPVIEE